MKKEIVHSPPGPRWSDGGPSKKVLDYLRTNQAMNEIVQACLQQFPEDFFSKSSNQVTSYFYDEEVQNYFFVGLKIVIMKGELANTPLGEYLNNSLPNLMKGPGRHPPQYTQNYLRGARTFFLGAPIFDRCPKGFFYRSPIG